MARQRKRTNAPPPRSRWNWRRVAGGAAEFLRNIALISFGTPIIEPVLTGGDFNPAHATVGAVLGIAFLAAALIFDHERSD